MAGSGEPGAGGGAAPLPGVAGAAPVAVRVRLDSGGSHDDTLVLGWELRQKRRLRTRLASGREAGLWLERGTALRDGDRLQADDGTVIRVVAAAEPLTEARCADPLAFARCAYHLGNRHAPVAIACDGSGGRIRFPRDPVLAAMVAGLGASVADITAPFDPEPGAYAAAHHPHSGEQRHRGILHDQAAATPGSKRSARGDDA